MRNLCVYSIQERLHCDPTRLSLLDAAKGKYSVSSSRLVEPYCVFNIQKEVTVGDNWFIFKGSPFSFLGLTDFFEGKGEEEGKREREDYKYTI